MYNLNMQKVTFYTKLNCHLCDEAYLMLINVAYDIPLEIDVLDVTRIRNRLESKYADRIPVITTASAANELFWPFTSDDVRAYLER